MMWIVSFGCAILFFGIGVYARKSKRPMWFWADDERDASQITDVKQYNRENGVMWQRYSLWYFAAGVAEIWSAIIALVFLVLGCTLGIAFLIVSYQKIHQRYRVQ